MHHDPMEIKQHNWFLNAKRVKHASQALNTLFWLKLEP
jgi:hypothetical protein